MAIRGLYLMATTFMMVWGSVSWCTMDIMGWGVLYLIQNAIQFVDVMYGFRTVKLPPDLEEIYCEVSLLVNLCIAFLWLIDVRLCYRPL